jgi:TPR repeat protein
MEYRIFDMIALDSSGEKRRIKAQMRSLFLARWSVPAVAVANLFVVVLAMAHPQGHDSLGVNERYRHAIELRLAGSESGSGMVDELAADGFRPAQFDRYLRAIELGDADSDQWLWRAAGPTDPREQYRVGQRYLHGEGLPTDPVRAAFWFREAASQGHGGAQVMLSGLLERGDGVADDSEEALFWLTQAARAGSSEARYRLGLRQGGEAGRTWVERAARAGHTGAQKFLGAQLSRGGGYPEDAAAALHWLTLAADSGDPLSMLLVGLIHLEGRGTDMDLSAAYRWLKRAQLNGERRAGEYLVGLEGRLPLEDRLITMTEVMDEVIPDPIPLERFADQMPANQLLGHGSGFWIAEPGYLLTNYHVIDQCTEVRVTGYGVVELVASEIQNDIALLKGDHSVATWLSLSHGPIFVDDPVTALVAVHPDTDYQRIDHHDGVIRALQRPGYDSRFLRFDARLDQGDSGAPLINRAGQVIGLVVAKLTAPAAYRLTGEAGQAASFALRHELLRGFLDVYGVASSGRAEDSERAVVRVECWY